jgi:4-amino-4-deoxy-L-arabinose transferase-like glycosyltransferase
MSTIALSRPRAASLRLRLNPWLLAVLALAAVLCLWNLTLDGYSNTYYAAAAKAGSVSWKAWFFGALDPGSFITVDKPPLSLWLMGLSARVLGFSSFAILLPQALCSIASVGVLYSTVKRVMGNAAGVAAAVALALTPISVAIARVNNPDALLILLLVSSAWLLVRALETGRVKWLVWCGVAVGLAFMTKMLQGWMVLPALAITYLVAAKPAFWVRIRQLTIFGAVTVAVSAAWPVAVSLWPGSKPYIGGSTDGSIWNLIFGYNGFGRITGNESGMGGGGGGPTFGGAAGLWRMFNSQVGGQIAWLLPLAGISLLVGLWVTWKAPRTSMKRAFFVLFGLWAIVHVAVFSTQKGIFHPYYVSALAPAVAALSGAGVVLLWRFAQRSWAAWGVLAASVAGTAWLAVSLLNRTADFSPWLRIAIPVAAAVAIAASLTLRFGGPRSALAVAAVAGTFALAAGPASYSVANLGRALNGNNVLAGPASAGQGGFGGGGGGGGVRGGNGGPPRGGFTPPSGAAGTAPTGTAGGGASGGFGGGDSVSSSMISYLESHQGSAKYLVAATGSQTTAPIIIQSGKAVVTIGGFSGSDNAPTLAQFEQMVAKGEVKYVLLGGQGGGGGFGGNSSISSWVQSHGKAVSGYSNLYEVSV